MAKQFLDSTGLNLLWNKITTGFAPTWKAIDGGSLGISTTATGAVLAYSSTGAAIGADAATAWNLNIPAATQTKAGLMTAADKIAIDGISGSITAAVPFKGLQINSSALALDSNKVANFNLVYNKDTDTLDIVDVNATTNKVKTSVSVNSFIGDALLNGVLSEAVIVNKDKDNNTGTFLKLSFTITKNDGTSDVSTVYANVADLISTYVPGTGIDIITTGTDINNDATVTTISIKAAATNALGGIKVSKVFTTNPTIQSATTYANRYFPVELTSAGQAIVNIPSSTVAIGTPGAAANGGSLSHGGTITVVTAIQSSDNTTSGGSTITPVLTQYTLPAAPAVEVTTNTTVGKDTLTNGDKFTVVTGIEKNNHGVKVNTTEFTLPTITIPGITTTGTSTDEGTIIPGGEGIKVLENITSSEHTITRDYKTIKVADPASIPDATINALAYPS